MDLILILVVLFFLIALIKVKVYDYASKMVIYCFLGYWMTSLIVSTFNFFDLYEVSTRAYVYLLINVISIVIGYVSVGKRHDFCLPSLRPIRFDAIFRSKVFWVLFLVVLLFGFETLRAQFAVLLVYSTGNIKIDPMGLLFEGSKVKYYFFNLFCTPFYYVCMGLFAYFLLYERHRKIPLILLACLVIIYSLIGGGRVSIMFIAFYLMMFFFWGERINKSNPSVKQIHISFKTILIACIVAALLVVGMTFVTALGMSGLSGELNMNEAFTSLMKQIVVYSVGPFRAFDYALQHPSLYFHDWCWGRATFCGLDYLLSLAGNVFGIPFTPINYETLSILQDTTIDIGKDESFNYAYTNTMYSYYDFRLLGIVLIGFLMGRFYRYVIWLCCTKSSPYYFLLSCFTFYILMHTVFSNYFNKNFTIPLILILLILGKKQKVKYSSL